MAREWTESHIIELIKQNATPDPKKGIIKDLQQSVFLELSTELNWSAFVNEEDGYSSNIMGVLLSCPENYKQPTKFADMFANNPTVVAPLELSIWTISPFKPLPPSGFLGYIPATRPIDFQTVGGWSVKQGNSWVLSPDPDNLSYPFISFDPMQFNGCMDPYGRILRLEKRTHTIYIDTKTGRVPFTIPVLRVSVENMGTIPPLLTFRQTTILGEE